MQEINLYLKTWMIFISSFYFIYSLFALLLLWQILPCYYIYVTCFQRDRQILSWQVQFLIKSNNLRMFLQGLLWMKFYCGCFKLNTQFNNFTLFAEWSSNLFFCEMRFKIPRNKDRGHEMGRGGTSSNHINNPTLVKFQIPIFVKRLFNSCQRHTN